MNRLRQGTRAPVLVGLPVLAFVLLLAGFGALNVTAQTHGSPLPPPNGYVNDYANVIGAPKKAQLETILTNLKERANIEIAVVTVATTNGEDIFDYSLAVARGWGIGSKEGDKAGLLLLVAINDRKYYTQISDHLEGDLPDGLAGQIQRERLVPQFKRGDYSQGIYDTVQAYIATLAEKRGFKIDGIDPGSSYGKNLEMKEQPSSSRRKSSSFPCCTVIIVIFIIIMVLSSIRRGGGGRGGGFGSILNMFLLGSLINSVTSGGRSSSGWSSGGFGGSSGGGGFGGFGGGGSFGGGGAGGSW